MFEFFKTIKYTLRDFKILFSGVLFASLIGGLCAVYINEPEYEVTFEISPYFEMAQDIELELIQVANAINTNDLEYIRRRFNVKEIGDNIIGARYWKRSKLADYSFKHVNLALSFKLSDTAAFKLKPLSEALIDYCKDFVADTSKSYRGLEVYKTKIECFKNGDFKGVKDEYIFQFHKNDLLRQDLVVSDSTVNQLVYLQALGEYRSAFKINIHQTLLNSLKVIPPKFISVELFLLIQFGPFLILLILLRAYKYE